MERRVIPREKKINDGIITLRRGDLGGMEPGGCGWAASFSSGSEGSATCGPRDGQGAHRAEDWATVPGKITIQNEAPMAPVSIPEASLHYEKHRNKKKYTHTHTHTFGETCLREANNKAYTHVLFREEGKKQTLLLSLLLILKWPFLAVLSKGFLYKWPSIIDDAHLSFPASY